MWARATRAWGGLAMALVVVCTAHAATAQTASVVVVNQWASGFQAEVRISNPGATALTNWVVEMDLAASITSLWDARIVSHVGQHYVIAGAAWNPHLAAGATLSFGFVASPFAIASGVSVRGAGVSAPTATRPPATATRPPASVTRTNTRPPATPTRTPTRPTATRTNAPPSPTPTATRPAVSPTATATRPPATPTPTATRPLASATPTATALAASGVRVTFARTSVWDRGYNGEVRLTNTGAVAVSGWTLQFDLADRITSLWSGVIQTNGPPHWAVRNESWNGSIASGATVSFGFTADGTSGVPSACRFNGAACRFEAGPAPTSTPGAGAAIQIAGVDQPFSPALQLTVVQGVTDFALALAGGATPAFSVASNNPAVADAAIVAGPTLRITAVGAGRAGLRITDAASGAVRHIGVRVRTSAGALPGLPEHLAIGSVSEDSATDLGMWRGFGSGAKNRRVDIRYIYLNGGPIGGWYDWQGGGGNRARSYIRESQTLGMVPFFVWYNIPDAGESYFTDLAHIQSASYMTAYWDNLVKALDIIRTEGGGDLVGLVLEPDFIGYMMQLSGRQPTEIGAAVHTVYDSGVLSRASDPAFPDTLVGLVQAVNYLISRRAPNAVFGWQFNLWASLTDGSGIPASGLMRITDSLGIDAGRARIALEAQRIADYYLVAGVASYGAHFVSIDKYGLDGGFGGAATAPWSSTWFWNAIHWNNYLLFSGGLHQRTGLPVVLWQLPVGHVNHSLAANPYDPSGTFPDLDNTTQHYEDSAPSFFYGDRFDTGANGQRLAYFGAEDPEHRDSVSTAGSVVEWREHLSAARDAGVIAALFGDGVGESTRGRGDPPPDGWWWMVKTQAYLANPAR
ncbi:MAG: cellulose binding domain-containing protein [Deltaproteobacteria bacterium]|nr:cellulose binding domain-containing protein [Deltaproteobacteria bacterium]